MNQQQLNTLKAAYSTIDSIDPCGVPYANLIAFLGRQTPTTLALLANANIKFVSSLAKNRLPRKVNASVA